MNRRDYLIIAALLLPFFIALPWGIWKSNQLADSQEEVVSLTGTLEDLEARQTGLGAQLNLLQQDVVELRDTVREKVGETVKLRAENSKLRVTLTGVQRENQRLTEENLRLVRTNGELQQQIKEMSGQAAVKASGFEVALLNNAAPEDAPEANQRVIVVNFAMNDVPEENWGDRPIYVVVTDPSGEPVTGSKSLQARSVIDGRPVDFPALGLRNAVIGANQILKFRLPVPQELSAGTYRVRIFSDLGLAGTAELQVAG